MAIYKAEYYRFNGTSWDLFYFRTSADTLVETESYKVMTAGERTAIATYLSTFNAAGKLVQLNGENKIPSAHLPSLSYLPLAGGTLSGNLTINGAGNGLTADRVTANTVRTKVIMADADLITFNAIGLDFETSGQIYNLATPTTGDQAANKEYVDNLISVGFKVKAPVKAASVGNVTIAAALNALDGHTLASGDRVLLKDQTTPSERGVYQLNASKIPAKVEADSTIGSAVFVENGETNNDYIYTQSELNSWVIFTKPDTIKAKAGGGLIKDGTEIGIATNGVSDLMLQGGISNGKIATFTSSDEGSWGGSSITSAGTSKSLGGHLGDLYSAIRLIRGTDNYHTSNTQSIAGAYTHADNIAASRNKTRTGTDLPSALNVTGDLFFKTPITT